eukprot:1902510-Amphidinium_carterae.1
MVHWVVWGSVQGTLRFREHCKPFAFFQPPILGVSCEGSCDKSPKAAGAHSANQGPRLALV